jgi:NAD(P)-dependent dehydrogenase (short-subunit alcohol dehydrogenase family)
MKDEWVLVTGSSRGLGLEIAVKMAESGFRLVITGRDQETLARAMERLNSVSKPSHLALSMDLTEENAPVKLHRLLKDHGVSLSVIVNNLGGGIPGDRRNIPIDILRLSMRLNLEVGVEINNLFYEDVKAHRGVIVHIGSTAALHFDAPPGYVISKAAVSAYVKNAARTFAREGVCIFAVLPGILEHEGSYIRGLLSTNPERYNRALSGTPFGRFTSSEETAQFIAKTIEAHTPMLNGALIQFDGGKE